MKILILNLLAFLVFATFITGLFVWEAQATSADKKFCEEQYKGFKSMY